MTFLDPISNGEYDPPALDPVAAEARRRVHAQLPTSSLMDRRRFLAGLCGSALALLTLDACNRESGGGNGGGFSSLPPESTTEPEAAATVLSGEEFVFDLQTHLLEGGTGFGRGFPQAGCGDDDCFSIEHWLEAVFVRSDTSLAVLSAIPAATPFEGPLSIAVMEEARRVAEAAECDDRVLLHGQAVPSMAVLSAIPAATRFEGPLSIAVMEEARRVAEAASCDDRVLLHGQAVPTMAGFADAMRRVASEHRIVAWKAYTHVPKVWRLDDAVGEAFIRTAVDVGVPTICVHKGLGSEPSDVGPAAAAHPDVRFVAYHSGYEVGQPDAIDRMTSSLARAGVGPGGNVWCELGSTWFNVMRTPDAAAHVLGKLLKAVGPDRVVWGTDSIWYGSPQEQIRAFRAFEISAEFQERFGYPALTPELKGKILGLNAAALHGVEPVARPRCEGTLADLERMRSELPPAAMGGPRTSAEAAAVRAADWAWQVPVVG